MRITFLLGNGFDLNLGLATTFSSFLSQYTKENPSDSDNLQSFKNDILEYKKCWSDAEIAFGIYTDVFIQKGKNAEDFYECYDDFCEQLADYLVAQERRIDFDSQATETAEAFAKSIRVDNIINNFSEVQREQLNTSISQFGEGFSYCFVDFNYTTTLDSCISITRKANVLGERIHRNTRYGNTINSLIHVHGYTTHQMVLGVNDADQIASVDLFEGFGEEYLDQLIKYKANGLNEENTDRKAAKLIAQSELIYIYGMSLGDTDKLWWERVMKRMLEHSNVHLIIYSHNAPETKLLPRKNKTWENEMKNIFIEKSGIKLNDGQRQSILPRIHIDRKNIFEPLQALQVAPIEDNVYEPTLT